MARADPALLQRLVTELSVAEGVPEPESARVAETLVASGLWGHRSHGVMRAPWFLARLRSGEMRRATVPEWLLDAGAIGEVDARDGIGTVTTAEAIPSAIARAKARHLARGLALAEAMGAALDAKAARCRVPLSEGWSLSPGPARRGWRSPSPPGRCSGGRSRGRGNPGRPGT